MFLAMNRFKIVSGKEEVFEKIWRERDSHLEGVDGFYILEIKQRLIVG